MPEHNVEYMRWLLQAPCWAKEWTALCSGGIFGLPFWAKPEFDVVGNTGERDIGVKEVFAALEFYADRIEGLDCVVHVGESRERDECIATITCVDRTVLELEPQVTVIPQGPRDSDSVQRRLMAALKLQDLNTMIAAVMDS